MSFTATVISEFKRVFSRDLGRSRDFGSSLTMVAGSRLNSWRAMWRKFLGRFTENVRSTNA